MSNTFNVSSATWSTAGNAASGTDDSSQPISSWEPAPLIEPEATRSDAHRTAFARLRAAIELGHKAAADREAALEDIKALVADQAISPDADDKPNSFSGMGVRVNRVVSSKWEQTTKAKERLAELTGDLRKAGEITETKAERWQARLV